DHVQVMVPPPLVTHDTTAAGRLPPLTVTVVATPVPVIVTVSDVVMVCANANVSDWVQFVPPPFGACVTFCDDGVEYPAASAASSAADTVYAAGGTYTSTVS